MSCVSQFIVPVDPNDVEWMAVVQPDFEFFDTPEPEAPDVPVWDESQRSELQTLIDKLSPFEADVISLYYLAGKTQAEIAKLFDYSEPALWYVRQRAIQRMQWLRRWDGLDIEQFKKDIEPFLDDFTSGMFINRAHVPILLEMYRTTNQSVAARNLGFSQQVIRNRLFSCVYAMRRIVAKYPHLKRTFEHIIVLADRSSYNMRHYQHSHWRGVKKSRRRKSSRAARKQH